jgi:hypothetical protein|tara:strand:- start:33204 stop:33551 length:348 start_codon:yes stop_codon:yes gene_type:complete
MYNFYIIKNLYKNNILKLNMNNYIIDYLNNSNDIEKYKNLIEYYILLYNIDLKKLNKKELKNILNNDILNIIIKYISTKKNDLNIKDYEDLINKGLKTKEYEKEIINIYNKNGNK